MVVVGSPEESASVGQQVRERNGDGLRGKAEGGQGRERELRGTRVGSKRQSPQGMEVVWQEGLLQAGCYRTNRI